MRVIGFAGWSGSGKTTLVVRLIPELTRRGFSVSTLKHTHHDFDVDTPGKDSYEHRAAGAREVLVVSARRAALISEWRGAPEPSLGRLLRRLAPVDLVLVEGYKRERLAKIELFRARLGKPPLHPDDPDIVALATDEPAPEAALPRVSIDDIPAIADLVLAYAEPIGRLAQSD
jgi:molybdopterin-guanine dinucleotide biosynthesis protein B